MKVTTVIKITLIGFAIAVVVGAVVMLLWNWLLPDLVGAAEIGFIQAIGLLILCKILFGNTTTKGRDDRRYWRKKLRQKMEKMSDSERSEFLQSLEIESADQSIESNSSEIKDDDR